jgi:hypothetical protein
MKRESFVFYRSFFEVMKTLQPEDQLRLFTGIANYALDQEPPEFEGVLAGFWMLILPQLSANHKRYENGLKGAEHGIKGGRPPKPQTNPTGNPTETRNENDNGNEHENENVFLENQRKIDFLKKIENEWILFQDHWHQKKNKPMTEPEKRASLKHLFELSNGDPATATGIINQAIRTGNIGFIKLKEDPDKPAKYRAPDDRSHLPERLRNWQQ